MVGIITHQSLTKPGVMQSSNSQNNTKMDTVVLLFWLLLFPSCDWVEAEKKFNYDEDVLSLYDWSSGSESSTEENWPSSMVPVSIGRRKRAAFGLLRLATKRPHKTVAELQHMPPQDTFLSVRGRKRSSFPSYQGEMLDTLSYTLGNKPLISRTREIIKPRPWNKENNIRFSTHKN